MSSDVPVAVGFSNLPTQAHRKAVKKGFELTIMVVGESGLGKSTLITSLFLLDSLYSERRSPNFEAWSRTTKIETHTAEIEESGIKVRLTIVDTPGYGDGLDCTQDIAPIIRYVDEQFERYYRDESGLNRRNITDTRVHCCLYFVAPSGCGLKPIDKEFIRLLQNKVNVVPIIAKADTLTSAELASLKALLLEQIRQADLKVFQIPEAEVEEDIEYKKQCTALKQAMPFGVVGAENAVEVKGRKIRGRTYPWGVVEIENPEHCDFVKLRTLLTSHMGDLRDTTHDLLYESYRAQRLLSAGPNSASAAANEASSSSLTNSDRHRAMDETAEKERHLAEKEQQLRELERKLKMQMQLQQQQQQQQQQQTQSTPNSIV